LKKGIGKKPMANDTHKDGWSKFGDLAVRIGDRDYRSENLKNPLGAYSPLALVNSSRELFPPIADMDSAIARLKLDAHAIAENLKLADAMALLHEVGMVMHKAAQR
jgi:hypothetical protein